MSMTPVFDAAPRHADKAIGWSYRRLSLLIATGFVAAIVLFLSFPVLDLNISDHFYDNDLHFYAGDTHAGKWAREFAADVPFVLLAIAIYGFVADRIGKPIFIRPTLLQIIFLATSLAVSSGLVVNLGMKDHLHRPRPIQVTEFGGPRVFRQFYQWDGACPRNCSFPSGEASSAFWLVAPASLAPAPYRAAAVAGALCFAALTGLLRMAFGGHFLSDVIFSGLITVALVVLTHWWVFRWLPKRLMSRETQT